MCQIVSLLAVNACQYILWDMKIRGIDLLEQINLRFIFESKKKELFYKGFILYLLGDRSFI